MRLTKAEHLPLFSTVILKIQLSFLTPTDLFPSLIYTVYDPRQQGFKGRHSVLCAKQYDAILVEDY